MARKFKYKSRFPRPNSRSVDRALRRMDLNPTDNKQKQPILAELADLSTQEAHEETGLKKYESLHVKNADDFLELSIENFRHIKSKLPLAERLPKPPSLHEYGFLLPKRSKIISEQFQDHWTASTLAYAAAAENFIEVGDLVSSDTIPEDSPVVSAARHALLTSSNVLARALTFYRYLCQRQISKDIRKPGTEKTDVITQADAKKLSQTIETRSKIRALTYPRGRGNRGRGRGKWRGKWGRRPRGRNPYFQDKNTQNDRGQQQQPQRN